MLFATADVCLCKGSSKVLEHCKIHARLGRQEQGQQYSQAHQGLCFHSTLKQRTAFVTVQPASRPRCIWHCEGAGPVLGTCSSAQARDAAHHSTASAVLAGHAAPEAKQHFHGSSPGLAFTNAAVPGTGKPLVAVRDKEVGIQAGQVHIQLAQRMGSINEHQNTPACR